MLPMIAKQPITLPNSEIHNFKSKVNGNEYKLFIILPKTYYANRPSVTLL